jgi:hypothetical protein
MAVSDSIRAPLTSPLLDDFNHNPVYERRIVAFYDVLGWRSKIAWAGANPERIGDLRRVILQHARLNKMRARDGSERALRCSTFSDNVVISEPLSNIAGFCQQVAHLQLVSALVGFWIRGGITIGDIVHDGEAVFGPALVRAYELEHEVAHYPRIALDHEILAQFGKLSPVVAQSDGVYFLDPFTIEFVKWVSSMQTGGPQRDFIEAGLPSPEVEAGALSAMPWGFALKGILAHLKIELRALPDKEHEKLTWLFDRIATQLGVPPSSSYPRVRPGDVID